MLNERMSACIDGGACHLADANGLPPCTRGCGIAHAKNSHAWPRIIALAAEGFTPCARVVERANTQPQT